MPRKTESAKPHRDGLFRTLIYNRSNCDVSGGDNSWRIVGNQGVPTTEQCVIPLRKEAAAYMPQFSIVITCYNQRDFILDAVESALSLNYANKEIIVVDDGSSDGSSEILQRYGHVIHFKVLDSNEGPNAARNCGASLAKGDYLVFLDGDDLVLPWALDVYDCVIKARKPSLILSSLRWFKGPIPKVGINDSLREIRFVEYETYMKKDRAYRASASALVVERHTFNNAGGWTRDVFPMDDIDLMIKLGYSGRAIQIWSPQTKLYRVHGGNTVHQVHRMIDGLYKVISKERSDQYPGGRACRFQRRAIIGGVVFFWVKTALRETFYRDGLRLLVKGWTMVLAAMLRRLVLIIKGRRPFEEIKM
jgi:glycosyltransferase involved in cell wall biosynthesis